MLEPDLYPPKSSDCATDLTVNWALTSVGQAWSTHPFHPRPQLLKLSLSPTPQASPAWRGRVRSRIDE
jgi:hypothetical protein